MGQLADSFDLGALRLSSGEAASVGLTVSVDPLKFGAETYRARGGAIDARLDVSRTTGRGNAMRLRFETLLDGPCMRCLGSADAPIEVDVREVDQPAAGDYDLRSPYLEDNELDLRAWVRDALALALPVQIVCDEGCRGLCAICGANLNAEPAHEHDKEPDPRWAKLSELKLE